MLREGAERFDLPLSLETDGLVGPVLRVVAEQAAFVEQEGQWVEGPRRPVSVREYNSAGFATYREYRHYESDGALPLVYRTVGDGLGHAVESVSLGPDGSVGSRVVHDRPGDDGETVTAYGADGRIEWRVVTRRDGHGHIVEKTRSRGDGSPMYRTTYAHDPDGRRVPVEYTHSRVRQRIWRRELCYDEAGRLVDVTRTRSAGQVENRLTQRYDAAGQLAEVAERDGTRALLWTETYTYDAVGNLTVQEMWGPDGMARSRQESWFDAQGRQVEQRHYGEAGLFCCAFTWEYDDQGRILASTEVEGGGASVTRTVVERDEYRNWTRATWYEAPPEDSGAAPKPLQVDYQRIDYYPGEDTRAPQA